MNRIRAELFRSPLPAGANGCRDTVFGEQGGIRMPGPAGRISRELIEPSAIVPFWLWNWFGHRAITRRALSDAPAAKHRLVGQWIAALPEAVEFKDAPGKDFAARHFVRAGGQSQRDACRVSTELILAQGLEAAKCLQKLLKGAGGPAGEGIGCLALALHALQDSFSASHVGRDTNFVIVRIRAWENRGGAMFEDCLPRPPLGWSPDRFGDAGEFQPGAALPLAEAAVEASRALFDCVLRSAENTDPAASFRRLAETEVRRRYLREVLAS